MTKMLASLATACGRFSERGPFGRKTLAATLAISLLSGSAARAVEFSDPIVLESPNARTNGRFGAEAVDWLPDANGDGVAEIAIGALGENRVYIFDGATQGVHMQFEPPDGPVTDFGWKIAGIGDTNGNGSGDLVVTTQGGGTYLFDGGTGEHLYTISNWAHSLSAVPDVDGDGIQDIVAGRNGAWIYSGADGELINTLSKPPGSSGLYGWSVSGIEDVNSDAAGDVIVSDWMFSGQTGRVYVFNGATGVILYTLDAPPPRGNDQFGRSVADLDDLNGDGVADIIVGASSNRRGNFVFDGATGEMLHNITYPPEDDSRGLGWVVDGVPDVTMDGLGDVLVVGRPDGAQLSSVYVYDGVKGEHLASLPGNNDYGGGNSMTGIPDINGDGLGDVLVANYSATSSTGVSNAGHVLLYLSLSSDDSDGDGLEDSLEQIYFGSLDETADGDGDGDTLTNGEEFIRGTHPLKKDTDGDGLNDALESGSGVYVDAEDTGTDPLRPDTDEDGLSDGVETRTGFYVDSSNTGTDPLNADSDGDSRNDGIEAIHGTDPHDPTDPPAEDSLEGYWSFDEGNGSTASDFSRLSRHAQLRNGLTNWVEGRRGGAILFDGGSDLVVPDWKGIGGADSRTISYWINTTAPATPVGGIVGWGRTASGRKWHTRLNENPDNGVLGAIRTEIEGSFIIGSTPLNDGVWHHVVSIFPEDGVFMQDVVHYIDGVREQVSGMGSSTLAVNTDNMDGTAVTFGSRLQGQSAQFYRGALDEVSIWSRALSENEINQLANGSRPFELSHLDPYEQWLVDTFSASQLANPAISSDDVDIDGDGFNTIAEWAFRLDPFQAEPLAISTKVPEGMAPHVGLTTDQNGSRLSITFLRRIDRADSGLSYHGEFSSTLQEWNEGEISGVEMIDEDWEQVTVLSPSNDAVEGAQIQLYARLAIGRPEDRIEP